jgi:Major Facilitator Superfamily
MSIMLALLVFSVFINYIDGGNLSIAAPLMKDELGISASQLGILLSSFFWTYGLFQILSSWLVDPFNVSWVMAIVFSFGPQPPAPPGSCMDLLPCRWNFQTELYRSVGKLLAKISDKTVGLRQTSWTGSWSGSTGAEPYGLAQG